MKIDQLDHCLTTLPRGHLEKQRVSRIPISIERQYSKKMSMMTEDALSGNDFLSESNEEVKANLL